MDSKNNHPSEGVYNINSYKHLSTLAKEYFTEIVTAGAASRTLRAKINEHEELKKQMAEAGYSRKTLMLSPKMQLILYRFLGAPHIAVPTDPNQSPENEEGIQGINDRPAIYF